VRQEEIMSGGSWEYLYSKIDDAADTLIQGKEPLRRAFGKKMKLYAAAMHDIEWVDSGDYGEGEEVESIEKALGEDADNLMTSELIAEATALKDKLEQVSEKLMRHNNRMNHDQKRRREKSC
jgi:hypothetical protein